MSKSNCAALPTATIKPNGSGCIWLKTIKPNGSGCIWLKTIKPNGSGCIWLKTIQCTWSLFLCSPLNLSKSSVNYVQSLSMNHYNQQLAVLVLAEQVILRNTKHTMMQIIYRLGLTFNIDLGPRHVRITSAMVWKTRQHAVSINES